MRKSFILWTIRGKTLRPVAFEFLRDEWPQAMRRRVWDDTTSLLWRVEESALRFLEIEEETTI